MKKSKHIQKSKMIFLFFLAMFVFNGKGLSQKNTIKLTPFKFVGGKMNIGYERHLNKEWSIIVDAQRWFVQDRSKKKVKPFEISFGPTLPKVKESNKGTRFSLQFRRYSMLKEKNRQKRNFYVGFGGFVGNHQLSMEREYYSHTSGGWFSGNSTTTTYPKVSGEVDLISGGIFFDFGYQLIIGEMVTLEFGLITGGAWTNQEKDYLTLVNYEPYNLEPENDSIKESFSRDISDVFVQPMLSLGFSF